MNYETHIKHFGDEADRFADAVARADLDATVVSCPDWTVRDLARHLGGLYRWSATIVREQMRAEIWPHQLSFDEPAETDRWADWVRAGIATAVEVFRNADPSERVWVWGADPHVRFWPRRMLFETVVHRMDIALTVNGPIDVLPEVAAEGIDEWLENLICLGRWRRPDFKHEGERPSLSFAADDTADTWRVGLTPSGGWWWDRGSEGGQAHVRGPASGLLLLLQGRSVDNVSADGDVQLLQDWLAATKFD